MSDVYDQGRLGIGADTRHAQGPITQPYPRDKQPTARENDAPIYGASGGHGGGRRHDDRPGGACTQVYPRGHDQSQDREQRVQARRIRPWTTAYICIDRRLLVVFAA